MKQFFHYLSFGFTLCLLLAGCKSKQDAPLLEGSIQQANLQELSLVYDLDGEVCVETITTDSIGHFAFYGPLKCPATDVVIYAGSDLYGVYLEKGKQVRMQITADEVKFEGDHVDRCRWNNTYHQAFSPWLFKSTPDHPFNADEWNATLEKGYQQAMSAAKAVSDEKAREAYIKLTEARKKYYIIQFLAMSQRMVDHDDKDQINTLEATKDSLIATIDPNADESRLSGLITYWYNQAKLGNRKSGEAVDLTQFFVGQIQAVYDTLTNEGNKKSLFNTLTQTFLMYQPSDSCIQAFRTALATQLSQAPSVDAMVQQVVDERANQIKVGDKLPSDPQLIAIDGSKTTLSKVIAGKVAYIDIWATWCAPCCREIPYMEKVAQHFKGNEKIIFVSISQDDNYKAWEGKMEKDQPEWPNFIFEQKSGREFLNAMSINAIPRFLIVGKDGSLIALDAIRPSDKEINNVLNQLLTE